AGCLGRQVRDQAVAGEELARFLEGEVGGRDHEVRRGEGGVVEPLAPVVHDRHHPVEDLAEARLVLGLDRVRGLLVGLVELACDVVGEAELRLVNEPHDHSLASSFFAGSPPPPSSFCVSPVPSSAFNAASSWSTCADAETCASSRSSWLLVSVKSSSEP